MKTWKIPYLYVIFVKKIIVVKNLSWFYVNTLQNNQLNFKFISTLNKIEECFIAPHLAFTQIFQLKGYGQYGMHGNIIHVVTNLNLV